MMYKKFHVTEKNAINKAIMVVSDAFDEVCTTPDDEQFGFSISATSCLLNYYCSRLFTRR